MRRRFAQRTYFDPESARRSKEPIFNYILGFCSLAGLCFTVAFTYIAYKESKTVDFREIIVSLSLIVIAISLTFIIFTIYYVRRINKLNSKVLENDSLARRLNSRDNILKSMTECIHNIFHYYRNINNKCDEYIFSDKPFNEKAFNEILSELDKFFATLTSNLHSFFTLFTGDRCAISIKIVKRDKKEDKVKTFYRDSISYRRRRKNDRRVDGSDVIYNVLENTAFKVILDNKSKDTTFLHDSLPELGAYENRNPNWQSCYRATAVVPISHKLGKKNGRVIGFLCVDNFAGGLANRLVEDFLLGAADTLFDLFKKYDIIITQAKNNGVNNEKVAIFTNWDTG